MKITKKLTKTKKDRICKRFDESGDFEYLLYENKRESTQKI